MPDIPFWNKCDNRCVMCTNDPSFARQGQAEYRLKGQVEKMERWLAGRGRGYLKNSGSADFLSLTGGEPTLHPEFFMLLSYFRKRLPRAQVTLLTNGRRFADADFTRRFAAAARRPFSVAVPLHGPDARLHDAVSGVRGSFASTVKGLSNLMALAPGVGLEIRLVLHRMNAAALPRTLAFLLKKFPDVSRYRVVVIHYEIEGMSAANASRVELRFAGSAAALAAAQPLIARFPGLSLYHFPHCVLPAGLRPLCRITQPREDRAYPPACRGCAARRRCPGLMAEYFRRFGAGELRRLAA